MPAGVEHRIRDSRISTQGVLALPALSVLVQNSVAVGVMGSATSQQLIIDASLAPLRTPTSRM